nr:Ig-like domain-containing protein [Flavobacteriales bacterium]
KYLFFCLTSTVILWQCASIQSPSGGEKDVNPPVVLSSSPEQGATNVNPSLIEIKFDEFFVLKNLSNELLISPPLNEKPIISQKGKSLFIELQESLNQNSTYTLNFGKGIADFHEGNVLKDYSLIFSTGSELDSLTIQGKVLPCPDKILPEGLVVGIYQKDSLVKDSTIYLNKPDYFSLVDEQGLFHIEHIRSGHYELISFEDVNANYQYDGVSEQIAFHNNIIDLSDSTAYEIWLFAEEDELKLLDSKNNKGRLHWAFNREPDSFEIHSEPSIEYYSKIEKDSLFVWPLNTVDDSVFIWTEVEQRRDTILVKADTLRQQKINIITLSDTYLKDSDEFRLNVSAPITEIDTSKIELIADSVQVDFVVHKSDFALAFEFEHKGNQQYDLTLHQGAVKGLNKSINDSTKLSFYTKEESALASLKINVASDHKHYFIELLKKGEVSEKIYSGTALYFEKLLPSEYELRLIADSNNDGVWTPGNYAENLLPEKVYYYPEVLNLRANWELEIELKIEN